jgi:predicted CoA-binding protein
MTSQSSVEDFLSQRVLAVVGASRDPKKFGNSIYRELKAKGYRVMPVNPHAETVDGDPCYPNLAALPETPGGIVVVVPPAETEKVVQDALVAKIPRVWLQRGAESPEAIRYCAANGIQVISGECILMFAQPAAFYHKIHRFFRGKLKD